MKCDTCEQSSLARINNRLFCVNCGQRAAERLREFKPSSTQGTTANILDLSPTDTKTAASPPQIKARSKSINQPGSELKQTTGIELPVPDARPMTGRSLQGMPARGVHNRAVYDSSQSTASAIAAAAINNPAAPAAAPDKTTAGTASVNVGGLVSSAPTTVMRPHQTYAVKDTPPAVTEQKTNTENYFEPQIKPEPKKPRRFLSRFGLPRLYGSSVMKAGSIALSILLLTGYVTYLNYPNIAIRVAASRANISATLPEYTPQGYKFSGPITYSPGGLTVTFNRGAATITLSQTTTRWNSESLLEDYVKYQASTYETFRENGLTIYTYNDSKAVWVNGGMLYRIDSSDTVSKDDILKMASSL